MNQYMGSGPQQRSVSASGPSTNFAQNAPQQPSASRPTNLYTIESTVTRLLVATKQLLESLTQWARREASEQDVSDIYVTLGNEFNIACRAFLSSGVEVAYVYFWPLFY